MLKKLLVVGAAAGLTLGLTAGTASAAGYGTTVKGSCLGATYGQLVSGARQAGHIEGGVSGARAFVEDGGLALHEGLC